MSGTDDSRFDVGVEENMGLTKDEIETIRRLAQKLYDKGYSDKHMGLCWIAAFSQWMIGEGHGMEWQESPDIIQGNSLH